MIVVVSDTSPIRTLDSLGLLSILSDLFEHVLVPPAVQRELNSPLRQFEAIDVAKYDFLEVRAPQDAARVQEFLRTLDRGESEALALALETGAQLILMDEKRGRRTSQQHGVVALGTLGILVRAKRRGLLPAIRPLIERLDELEFYMSAELKNNALRLAGE